MVEPCLRSPQAIRWGRGWRVRSVEIRRIYAEHTGRYPTGLHVHHSCGNPWCIEPTHLEALEPKAHREMHKYGTRLTQGFNETF
jgi:hypothetical protein